MYCHELSYTLMYWCRPTVANGLQASLTRLLDPEGRCADHALQDYFGVLIMRCKAIIDSMCSMSSMASISLSFMSFMAVLLCAISLSLFAAGYSAAQESYVMKIEEGGLLTLDATNVPLNTLLQALSRRIPLEIRGGVAQDERLSVQFSKLSLKEALGKMIRNYNYVLVMPEGREKPVLTIVNQITRTPSREESPPAVVTKGSAAPAPPQGAPPAPGQASGRVPGIQDGSPSDAEPGPPTVQERRGIPRTALPGMQPGPPMPGGSPFPSSMPQPSPQGATEAPDKKEAQAPVHEPVPSSVPETVMTPFGFRSVAPQGTENPPSSDSAQTPAGIPAPVPTPSPVRLPQRQPIP